MELEDLRLKQGHFESKRQNKQKHYKNLKNLRQQFVNIFTTTKIKNMTKDTYVEGKVINGEPDKNTFCYWVEWRTEDLGKIQGSRTDKFGLYVSKKSQKYKFIKKFGNENEAFDFLKKEIIKLIIAGKDKNLSEIKNIKLSPMFKGKILFLYYPNKFINIFAESHIDYFLKRIGIYQKNRNLSLIDKREELLDWKNKDLIMKIWKAFEFSDFLYNELGRPLKKKRTPNDIKDYVDFEEDYPDPKKVKSKFIDLKIDHGKKRLSVEKRKRRDGTIDFERENKRHKRLGEHGELVVFYKEYEFLIENNHSDLAEKVKLISAENTRAGYDILSYELDGRKRYIEVKSTNRPSSSVANFIITINEYKKAKEIENYNLYIVFSAKSENPSIWRIKYPFLYEGKGLDLTPLSFRVTVNIK